MDVTLCLACSTGVCKHLGRCPIVVRGPEEPFLIWMEELNSGCWYPCQCTGSSS